VAIPAYQAMQENGLSERVLDVLTRGISTRQYAEVLPEMASSCGVSKSNVSREAAEAGEEALKELLERRFDEEHSWNDATHIRSAGAGQNHRIR
jgi:putative transposase